MRRTNYSYQKRMRDLAKQEQRAAKRKKREERRNTETPDNDEGDKPASIDGLENVPSEAE